MRGLAFVLGAVLLFSAGTWQPSPAVYAQSQTQEYVYSGSFDHDEFLREVGDNYQNRSVKSPQEDRAAALFVASYFKNMGLLTQRLEEADGPEDYLSPFTTIMGDYNTQNVIAIKPARGAVPPAEAHNVIIGAHYDNVYDYEITNPYNKMTFQTHSNGIYDNASGVAAMLGAAHDLLSRDLDFNLYFVAFGAEELGMAGSAHFISDMTSAKKQNTLLMINIDSVAGGDYLYLFTQDWEVPHDAFLRQRALDAGVALKSFPADKKFISDPLGISAYSHAGYLSDNYYFLKEGINTAFFTSFNLHSVKKAGFTESDYHENITHTYLDYYDKVVELYPDYHIKMQKVTDAVTAALTHEGFTQAMLYSSSTALRFTFLTSMQKMSYVTMALCLLFILLAFLYYQKISRISKAKMQQFLSDPKQVQKINSLFKEFENMNSGGNIFTYHPRTYKPKQGDKEFSVFGSEFEQKDEGYQPDKQPDDDDESTDNRSNPGGGESGGSGKNTGGGDVFKFKD